ncbi:MAG: AMP-binding protein, partial [Alphaproteobacteria bacterium]|nr:AMP-binding protein [Alphaproteobacteria bacterium]
ATDLFEEETIKRFADHFGELIRDSFKKPTRSLHDLSLLTSQEEHQLLIEWNDTKVEYPEVRNKTIHQLFEEQAERTPDNIAVIYEDQQLTYQQLNQKANQLAHHLRDLGVKPDTLIAIAMERSLEMIIGLLGILKAGGAYVPLDPSYPQDRLQFMLDDTQAPIILTDIKTTDKLPSTWSQVICLDEEWDKISALSSSNLSSLSSFHNLAYIIYTSGSTGKPKGVMAKHSNLAHSTLARFHYYNDPSLSSILLPSIAFDSSIGVIFPTLCQGGRLTIPSQLALVDPDLISDLIKNQSISHILCIPSFYSTLLHSFNYNAPTCMKNVIVAGESTDLNLAVFHKKVLPSTHLFNEYGPSEAAVWSSAAPLYHPIVRTEIDKIIIGKQRPNTQIYILDAFLNPVPIGVSGEIYIG